VRAKFIYESINFERGQDPFKAMGIGKEAYIKKINKELKIQWLLHDDTPSSALAYASGMGRLDWVTFILNNFSKKELFSDDSSVDAKTNALPWAADNGHIEIVKMLLDYGFDPTVLDNYALHWATQKNHLDVVNFLLKDPRVIEKEKEKEKKNKKKYES
jgi:hypothetical protein